MLQAPLLQLTQLERRRATFLLERTFLVLLHGARGEGWR